MRIVVAHPHFSYPGGASLLALETGKRLASRGHEVHFVSLKYPRDFATAHRFLHLHELGGPISSELGYWFGLPGVLARFHHTVDRIGPDAVLAHVFPANHWAFVDNRMRRAVPCIWYCHEPSAFVHDFRVIWGLPPAMRAAAILANPCLQVVDRVLARSADLILANSRYTAERVEKIYARRPVVVPPGVDLRGFDPRCPKTRTILTVGRLTRFKRVDLVVRAAASLRQAGLLDVQWVVAGDGEEGPALRKLARRLGVSDVVRFTGLVDRESLIDLYNGSLAVCVPAVGEPFGIVPLEALAAGTPVVCSDTGGPAATIEPGVTGLHFRAGDAGDLARWLRFLLERPDVASRMGGAGRTVVEDQYTWDRTTDGIEKALESGISAHFGPPSGRPKVRGAKLTAGCVAQRLSRSWASLGVRDEEVS